MLRKQHWENIYANKQMNEVSWFQQEPTTSLALIQKSAQSKDDAIIDIGGGDGFLADNLLELGYTNITILDISFLLVSKFSIFCGAILSPSVVTIISFFLSVIFK